MNAANNGKECEYSVDYIAFDLGIRNLCPQDRDVLKNTGLWFVTNTYFYQVGSYSPYIDFKKTEKLCKALFDSVDNDIELKKIDGLRNCNNPLRLMFYINKLGVELNKELLEKSLSKISQVDIKTLLDCSFSFPDYNPKLKKVFSEIGNNANWFKSTLGSVFSKREKVIKQSFFSMVNPKMSYEDSIFKALEKSAINTNRDFINKLKNEKDRIIKFLFHSCRSDVENSIVLDEDLLLENLKQLLLIDDKNFDLYKILSESGCIVDGKWDNSKKDFLLENIEKSMRISNVSKHNDVYRLLTKSFYYIDDAGVKHQVNLLNKFYGIKEKFIKFLADKIMEKEKLLNNIKLFEESTFLYSPREIIYTFLKAIKSNEFDSSYLWNNELSLERLIWAEEVKKNINFDYLLLDFGLYNLSEAHKEIFKSKKGFLKKGIGCLKYTYFYKEEDYKNRNKFNDPDAVCLALANSFQKAINSGITQTDLRLIRDPMFLLYYIMNINSFYNKQFISLDKNLFIKNVAQLNSYDARILLKGNYSIDGIKITFEDLFPGIEKDIEKYKQNIVHSNKNIENKVEVSMAADKKDIPSILPSPEEDLGQRMAFYMGKLSDFDRWFLNEYNNVVKKISDKLNEKNYDVEKKLESLKAFDADDRITKIFEQQKKLNEIQETYKDLKEKLTRKCSEIDDIAKKTEENVLKRANELEKNTGILLDKWGEEKKELLKSIEDLKKRQDTVRKVEIIFNRKGIKTVTDSDKLRHEKYEETSRVIAAGLSPYLVGPAGSGKSTILEQIAYDLKLPYYPTPVNGQTSEYNIIGYNDAKGQYVRTAFRDAYEKGGVFLFEEIDAGNPNIMTVINNSMSQSSYLFPDGKLVKKHDDFIVGASANTYGRGASLQYIGRNPLDAATVDRFAMIEVSYDTKLEKALATNKAWLNYVYEIRRVVENFDNTFYPEKLLFPIVHPSFLRRLCFSEKERNSKEVRDMFGFYNDGGYGFPYDKFEKADDEDVLFFNGINFNKDKINAKISRIIANYEKIR